MYLNAFTLSSLASTTAWTHWFLPLFAANWQMNSRLKTLVFLQQTRPITAKACRKFSNSCFRDLSCFSELSLWRKSCSLKMPKSSETIYWYCLICVPLSFTMAWTWSMHFFPAEKTVSKRPKRSWSAVHASSYLSKPGMNFAIHDFALLSTESSRSLSFCVASQTSLLSTSTLNAALNFEYSSGFPLNVCTFGLTTFTKAGSVFSNNWSVFDVCTLGFPEA